MSKRFELYTHHDRPVWVRSDLKGKHREHCLCWSCSRFHPDDRANNCPIANALYAFDVFTGTVTPVWECPKFEEAAQ